MTRKYPIHTTISAEAHKVLERHELELGAKNVVLEKALLSMDKLRYKGRLDTKEIDIIIHRIKTGTPGLDELIEGGIPQGFIIIVTGPPGTAKTTFSIQFLLEGVMKNEKCIYFSFEEQVEQLAKHFTRFNINLKKNIDDGFLEIFGFPLLTIEEIIDIIETFKPKRVVFDSVNVLSEIEGLRRTTEWRSLVKLLKQNKITSIVITEKRFGLEVKEFDDFDFMGDGIFFFDKTISDQVEKYTMSILKLRATNVQSIPNECRFTEKGFEIFKLSFPS